MINRLTRSLSDLFLDGKMDGITLIVTQERHPICDQVPGPVSAEEAFNDLPIELGKRLIQPLSLELREVERCNPLTQQVSLTVRIIAAVACCDYSGCEFRGHRLRKTSAV